MINKTGFINYVFKNVFSHYINGYFEIYVPKTFSHGISTEITKVYPGDVNCNVQNVISTSKWGIYHIELSISRIKRMQVRFYITEHEDNIDIKITNLEGTSTWSLIEGIKGNPYQEYLRLKLEYS